MTDHTPAVAGRGIEAPTRTRELARSGGSLETSSAQPAWYLAAGLIVAGIIFLQQGRDAAAALMMVWLVLGCLYYAVRDMEGAGLSLFAFAIPLEQTFYSWAGGPWNTLTYTMIVIIALAAVNRRSQPIGRKITWPELWIGAWLSWSLLSLLWSPAPAVDGVKQLVSEAGGVVTLFAFYRWASSAASVNRWLTYFVAGNALMTLVLWLYYDPGQAYVWNQERGRFIPNAIALGTDISPNVYARITLLSMLACLGGWSLAGTRRVRAVCLGLALFFGLNIPLSWSRTAIIAEVLAIGTWMATTPSRRLRSLIMGLVILVVVLGGAWQLGSEALIMRVRQTVGMYEDENYRSLTSGRSDIWAEGAEIFLDHPIGGVGYSGFSYVYEERTGRRKDDHNVYLQTLSETGLIGGLLFLGIVLSLGMSAYRAGAWRPVTLGWWIVFALVLGAAGAGRLAAFWMVFGITLVLREEYRRAPTFAPVEDTI